MTESDRQGELSQTLLGAPYDALTPLQRSVVDLICSETPSELHPALRGDDRSFGQRLADRVAAVGGSWGFIIAFGMALTGWIGWNEYSKGGPLAFDPYPFIFLNLILSMLAAIQAPVIMMSQNRQALRDRTAAEHDSTVNLRAELEIMHLHDKMDDLRGRQIKELLERQAEAIELLKQQVTALAARG